MAKGTDIKKKVFVSYRVYPNFSKYANKSFFKTKYEMFRAALRTFIRSLEGTDFYVHFILDSCPSEYSDYIKEVLPSSKFEIEPQNNAGNRATFLLQIDAALKQKYSSYVYFAEDDYIYTKNSMAKMIDVIEEHLADFVSPYDHPDYYRNTSCVGDYKYNHNYKTKVFYVNGHHFRMSSSTTLTFLTTVEKLKETQKIFRLFKKYQLWGRNYPGDYEVWLALTHMRHSSLSFLHTGAMYRSTLPQFFRRKYILLTPIPGLAFHLNSNCVENYGLDVVSRLLP